MPPWTPHDFGEGCRGPVQVRYSGHITPAKLETHCWNTDPPEPPLSPPAYSHGSLHLDVLPKMSKEKYELKKKAKQSKPVRGASLSPAARRPPHHRILRRQQQPSLRSPSPFLLPPPPPLPLTVRDPRDCDRRQARSYRRWRPTGRGWIGQRR